MEITDEAGETEFAPLGTERALNQTSLSQAAIDACASLKLKNASDINAVFAASGGFYEWYNDELSHTPVFRHRGPIHIKQILLDRFLRFWDTIPWIFGQPFISGLEFCALMSVNIQENSGDLSESPEEVGAHDHPGLAYAFDTIPNVKSSYNVNASLGNWTALKLFQNADYVDAHRAKAGFDAVTRNGVSQDWGTAEWPERFSTKVDETVNGFIMQADFYKFRGRGVIQTTGRDDYKILIRYILDNPANLQTDAKAISSAWGAMPVIEGGSNQLDAIASRSSNAQWDIVFADPVILAEGVHLDSEAKGKYLNLARDAATLNGGTATRGSLYYMARKINGGSYPRTVAPMMAAMIEAPADHASVS
jgi:hypothetical protein